MDFGHDELQPQVMIGSRAADYLHDSNPRHRLLRASNNQLDKPEIWNLTIKNGSVEIWENKKTYLIILEKAKENKRENYRDIKTSATWLQL